MLTTSLALVSALSTETPTPPLPLESLTVDPRIAVVSPVEPAAPLLIGGSKFSYTYVELDYLYTDLDGVSGHLDGYNFVGSLNLPLGFFVQGTYANSPGNFELETYRLGAGYHLSLIDKLDLYGLVSYEHDTGKTGGSSSTADGMELDAGARFMLGERFEVNGQLEWNNVDEDVFGGLIGARFYIISPLSVGVSGEWINDNVRLTVGGRFQF
jgi:hypothetical protein